MTHPWGEEEPPDEFVPTIALVGGFLGGVVIAAAVIVWAIRDLIFGK